MSVLRNSCSSAINFGPRICPSQAWCSALNCQPIKSLWGTGSPIFYTQCVLRDSLLKVPPHHTEFGLAKHLFGQGWELLDQVPRLAEGKSRSSSVSGWPAELKMQNCREQDAWGPHIPDKGKRPLTSMKCNMITTTESSPSARQCAELVHLIPSVVT